jgi:hypothetical protein
VASKRRRTATSIVLAALVCFLFINTVTFALSRLGTTVPDRNFSVRVSARQKVVLKSLPAWGPYARVKYQIRTKYGPVWLFGQWRTKYFYFDSQGTRLKHVARGVYWRCLPRSCRHGAGGVYK